MSVEALHAPDAQTLAELTDLLIDTVQAGASIGWVRPPNHEAALTFWQRVAASESRGERCWWVARQNGRIVGTVQLVLDAPENGRLRAEVCKLMTHPVARRQGLAQSLMLAAEAEARRLGKRLVLLDTNTDSPAQRLYERLGWQVCGVMPDYALQADGSLGPTTWMFKRL